MSAAPGAGLRVAIAGLGIAGESHLFDALAHPSISVVGVCARRTARAREIAGRFGVTDVYGELGELLRARQPDAVIVATPPRHQAEHALAALDAGAAVLLEKPGAATPGDCERLALAAPDRGSPRCVVAYSRRYRRGWQRVRELLSEGAIGPVRRVRLTWRGPYRARFAASADSYRAVPEDRVAGVVLDTGSHMVDLCQLLLGTTLEIASAALVLAEDDVDIAASWTARARTARHREVEIDARIEEDADAHEHGEIVISGARGEMRIDESEDRVQIAFGGVQFTECGYLARPIDDLVALGARRPVRGATIDDAVRAAAAVHAIYRAAGAKLDRARHWISPRAKRWGGLSGAC